MNRSSTRLTFKILIISAILLAPFSISVIGLNGSSPISYSFSAQDIDQEIYTPAFLDSVRIVEYNSITDALDALENGNADMLGHRINMSDYDLVDTYSNIHKQWAYEDGFYLLTINCEKSPLSSSYFRKAIAYTVNKTHIASDIMNDTVVQLDYAVGLNNEFCPEDALGGEFYDSRFSEAYQQLSLAGLLDVDEDGMVEDSDGSEFQLELLYPTDKPGLYDIASNISADLLSIGINNTLVSSTYDVIQNDISNFTTDYDLALFYQEIPSFGFEWTATTFDSDNIEKFGKNIARISDNTLDNFAYQYTDSTQKSYADNIGLNAANRIQELNPVIPLFSYKWLSVYTDANLEGWIDDTFGGAFGQWNPVSLVSKPGSSNELIVAVLPEYFDTFVPSLNPFINGSVITHEWITGYFFNPYMLIYDSPISTLPDGRPAIRHSTSWLVQFAGQASEILAGETRATYYCDPNANWTDGVKITAQDYKFSYGYLASNSLISDSDRIGIVKVIGDYVAGINYGKHELFVERFMGELPILPKHIWEEKNVTTWVPSVADMVGSGPFKLESYTSGSEMILTRNTEYYPELDNDAPTLVTYSLNPESPIPAESVSIRLVVNDRSRIENVSLTYTYRIGNLNFTNVIETNRDASGFEGLIPARVTADSVVWEVRSYDIWGNHALLISGEYSRVIEATTSDNLPIVIAAGGIGVVAVLAILYLKKK
ncbi:MAG: hypothetical protein GF411_00280 [Candidatus Lokiarchaeota archaeon]|nr:hypothetical protein [Candidatus Lokiarchaeota archaeon]